MSIVTIKDKTFKTSISESEIKQRVKALAERINIDMADKNPLFLCVNINVCRNAYSNRRGVYLTEKEVIL